jgi:hypothetical protein
MTCETYVLKYDNMFASTRTDSLKQIGKGKAIPLQALIGPEGSRRLNLPDFKKIDT